MLKNYFEDVTGTGVLATADASGKVNAALYGKPHSIEGDTRGFAPPNPPRRSKRQARGNVQSRLLPR